jgi:hypothetical protein
MWKYYKIDVGQMDERQRNRVRICIRHVRSVVLIAFRQYEQTMKRRAEQSARDKERHRKMMEDREKAQFESPTQSEQSEYVPLTPVSADAAHPESMYVSCS